MSSPRRLLFLIGQTASGKNALSHLTAHRHQARIISVDSMKVYRGMNVGTATPSLLQQEEVPYHMINMFDPLDEIDLKWYIEQADAVLAAHPEQAVILSGGSSMYIKGLLSGVFEGVPRDEAVRAELQTAITEQGLEALHAELAQIDPDAGKRILPGDAKRIIRALEVYRVTGRPISSMQNQFDAHRPEYDFTVVGLRHPRPALYARIEARVDRMFDAGLVAEVTGLHQAGLLGHTASQAIGYCEIIKALREGRDPGSDEVREEIKKNTRRFARKQMTWFRKFTETNWLDIEPDETIDSLYKRLTPFFRSCYDD